MATGRCWGRAAGPDEGHVTPLLAEGSGFGFLTAQWETRVGPVGAECAASPLCRLPTGLGLSEALSDPENNQHGGARHGGRCGPGHVAGWPARRWPCSGWPGQGLRRQRPRLPARLGSWQCHEGASASSPVQRRHWAEARGWEGDRVHCRGRSQHRPGPPVTPGVWRRTQSRPATVLEPEDAARAHPPGTGQQRE